MNKSRLFLFYCLAVAFGVLPTNALAAKAELNEFNKPMTFVTGYSGGNCNECAWIVATGVITERTPEEFKRFLSKNNHPGGTIYFHSPGGNLLAGIKLGYLIRENQMSTVVGETTNYLVHKETETYVQSNKEGICASSCAYAFLGGITRKLEPKSVIGFHQFYNEQNKSTSEPIEIDGQKLSSEQVLSGLITSYVVDMGIDARILLLASSKGKDSLYNPNDKELIQYGILTNDAPSDWALTAVHGGLIMAQTYNDIHDPVKQAQLFCSSANSRPSITVITTARTDWSLDMFKSMVTGLSLNIGKLKYDVQLNQLEIMQQKDRYYLSVTLPEMLREPILANGVTFNLDTPHVVWGNWVNTSLVAKQKDRETLRIVWKNCVGKIKH